MTRQHDTPTGDSGFTLVEVLAAMVVFSLLALAATSTLASALGLTRTNEGRVVAANVAARAVEAARVMDPVVLQSWAQTPPPADSVVSVVVGPTTYTVRHLVSPVEAPAATSPCRGSTGPLRAYRIQVEVTWPRQDGMEPVRSETVRALGVGELAATTGSLAVSVKDRNGAAVVNQRLDLTPTPATGPAYTDGQGCGVFTELAPRNDYSVTTPTSDGSRVNRQGRLAASRAPLTVRAGSLTHEELYYDAAVEVQATIPGPSGYPAPSTLGVTVTNPQLATGLRTYAQCPSGTTVTATTTCVTGSPKRVLLLFPFLDGYQIWAGTCSDDRPADPISVRPLPGTVPSVQLRTAPLRVTGLPNDWVVTGTNSCGSRHTLGTTSGASGANPNATLQASLPAGRWTFAACNNPCTNSKTATSPLVLTIPAPATVPEVKFS